MLKEFFGFGGYTRVPEGYMSWQHLTFVTALMIIMVICAVIFGRKYKDKDLVTKNKVLITTAILIDGFELFKIFMMNYTTGNSMHWLKNLPLFLCSIHLITIPLAAFSKGKLKEAALDFVFIFGVPSAILGTYLAGNNYTCYPVLSFDNVVSGITHSLSGFAALYIVISGMQSMKKTNISNTFAIIGAFSILAYIANVLIDYNYMFLMRGDGTPYDILYNLVNGSPILYPLMVVGLFFLYICIFYEVYYLITMANKQNAHKSVNKKSFA